jgi:hypothetical protein
LEDISRLAQASAERQLTTMVEIFPLFTAALFSDLELGKKLYREQITPILKERAEAVGRLLKPGLDADIVEAAVFGMIFALAMDQTLGEKKTDVSVLAEHLTAIAISGYAKDPAKT